MKPSRAYIIIGVSLLLHLLPSSLRGEYRYRLYLDGKPGSQVVPFSDRSLERRERQGIAMDSTDYALSPQYLEALTDAGFGIVTSSRWLNTVVVMRQDGRAVPDEDWEALPFVKRVETLTTWHRATSRLRDEEPMEDAGGGIVPLVDNCTSPLRQLNAYEPLYEAGYRGAGMLIAVLDAGFEKVDVWDWLGQNVIGTRDLYARNESASRVYSADSHGSHCLSILVSPKDHGVCGSAQEAQYYLVRTETVDSETGLEEDMWVAGAELADSIGADVISSSLGYYEFDSGLPSHTQDEFAQLSAHISRGAHVACQKGVLVCNAAGNEGNSYWRRLLFPADVEDVLTVGGVTREGIVTSFSSRGFTQPYIKPDVLARAQQCYTVNVNSATGAASSSGAGTSYATPLVAGLCASLWSAVPQLTAHQLREAVRQSAADYLQPDSIRGYGLPDFGEALRLARLWTEPDDESIATIRADRKADPQQYTPAGYRAGVQREGKEGLIIEGGRIIFRRKD